MIHLRSYIINVIIVLLCFYLFKSLSNVLSSPDLTIKLTDQSGRPLAGAVVYIGSALPIVENNTGMTWKSGVSVVRSGHTLFGVWGEATVTVKNNGGAGYVIVWAKWMSGSRVHEGNETIFMNANGTSMVTVFVIIGYDQADWYLGWYYDCGVTATPVRRMATSREGTISVKDLPPGDYDFRVTWKSVYNPGPVTILFGVTIDKTTTTIRCLVYDIELQLVTPNGKPIAGADVSLAGVPLGMTGADGKVVAPQVPSKYMETEVAYPVTAMWLGVDVSPDPVTIMVSKTYVLNATKVATLTVQVVGAQGQALKTPQVIMNSNGMTVFSGIGSEQGVVIVEVPYDTYTIAVDYKGFMNTATSIIDSATPVPVKIMTNVYIEIFGQAMTPVIFLLLIIVIIIISAIIVIVTREILHRKRLLQPIKTITNFHPLQKPICPKCGFSLEQRGDVFWCPNCVGWIAPKDVKWI